MFNVSLDLDHVAADANEWHMGVFYNITDVDSELSKAKTAES